MILKFTKCLNEKKEFSLVSFDMRDKLDYVSVDVFDERNCNVYETNENYYYYIKDIVDVGGCEKFKIKVKKGDIVSITARDNSYIVFPSKKSFSYAFNLKHHDVIKYKYSEVLLDGKPYEVKYVKDKEEKVFDGVVYTLSQLVSYISILIKSYNYKVSVKKRESKEKETINRVIQKYYSSKHLETDSKYELNVKKVGLNENNKWISYTIVNVSKSNRYLYDYYLLRMFAYMILTKSIKDKMTDTDVMYQFDRDFETIEEVYKYLEENQDIVNDFFIETEMLFNKPNDMFTSYSPYINGVYMFYDFNNIKTYLYLSKDKKLLDDKLLKQTYVSTRFRHKIRGIKSNYMINIPDIMNED